MSDEPQGAFSIVPDGFYDLIGILVPGVTLLGAAVLLQLPRLEVCTPTGWSQILGFVLAGYVIGHLLYGLSGLLLPKLAGRFGNPRSDLVVPANVSGTKKIYQYEYFVFDPVEPGKDNHLVARIREKWDLPQSTPDHSFYELCRAYVHIKSKERANFVRKEQAYGELARSLTLASLFISALAWLSPFSSADQATCSVGALLAALVFFWRYLHARQIDAVMVYYSFLVLRQEELEQRPATPKE